MFKKAETKNEKDLFNEIFKSSFAEKNYETAPFAGECFDILVENNNGKVSGTLELVPYKPGTGLTTVEDMFDFSKLDVLQGVKHSNIYEVDKLSVLEEERRNGTLDNIIRTMFVLAKEMDIEFYIGLANPILFRGLRLEYGLPVQKAGKLIRNDSYSIQPMYIHTKKLLEDTSWDKKNILKDIIVLDKNYS